jgi:hypothetical protein
MIPSRSILPIPSGERIHRIPSRNPSTPRQNERPKAMTVCAAVLCKVPTDTEQFDAVVGIADRMFTSGDVQFEGNTTKVFAFVREPVVAANVIALEAWDTNAHFALATETHSEVINQKIESVREIAATYARRFQAMRRERAERTYLAPLGLNAETFRSQQKMMETKCVGDLRRQMQKSQLDVQAIIAGIDSDGSAHLYRIDDPGQVTSLDRAGYCAIGSGARQFETQFMFERYDRLWPWFNALVLMYSAKKRAEVSPGVGKVADVFMIQNGGGGFLPQEARDALEEHYQKLQKAKSLVTISQIQEMIKDPRLRFPTTEKP